MLGYQSYLLREKVGKFVEVSGKFDVNVWYAYSSHSKTAVFSETVHYKDKVKLSFRDGEVSAGDDVRVRVIQEPNCIEAIISPCGTKFEIVVEREVVVEVMGKRRFALVYIH